MSGISALRRATKSSSAARIPSSSGGASNSASFFFHSAFARVAASTDPAASHFSKGSLSAVSLS